MVEHQRIEVIDQLTLLLYLDQNPGDLSTREGCAQALWGRSYNEATDREAIDRMLYSLWCILRKHVGDDVDEVRREVRAVLGKTR